VLSQRTNVSQQAVTDVAQFYFSLSVHRERATWKNRFQQAAIRSARFHPSPLVPRETELADTLSLETGQSKCAATYVARIRSQRFVLREMEIADTLSPRADRFEQAAAKVAPVHCSLPDHGAEISITLSHGTDQLECAAAKAAPIRPCLSVRRKAMNFPNGSL
jgi:hypothetical protein